MDLGLEGRCALVAGASRGLGYAAAEALAAEGVRLVICSRDDAAIERAAERIASQHGVEVTGQAADLSEPEAIERLHETARRNYGGVDILVTNTGGPPPGVFVDLPQSAWDAAVRNNLDSVLHLMRGVLAGMTERKWGRIVNVTSIAAKQPVANLILSNSMRAAVTALARTLAAEVAPHGITVNNVMPGYTRTERLEELAAHLAEARSVDQQAVVDDWEREIPAARLGEPAELAALVAFLASERAAYITGSSIAVDGGWIRALI